MAKSEAYSREDESPDGLFYRQPRFVEHIDPNAIGDVERLYRERLPAGGRILDLMSSWVSHLPPDVAYTHVTGLGMNAEELAANPRLDETLVHDLNADPRVPLETDSYDAAAICVSIQYLTEPVAVLRDLARVVRPGGIVAITFSNRCFPTKAVAVWQAYDDFAHLALVGRYLLEAGWDRVEIVESDRSYGDPLYAVLAVSPGVRLHGA